MILIKVQNLDKDRRGKDLKKFTNERKVIHHKNWRSFN